MKDSLLRWFDQYAEANRIEMTRSHFLPVMRWWEWVWYLAAAFVCLLGIDWVNTWLGARLATVPVLDWVPFLITWPAIGVLWWLMGLVLPAREARRRAPGEPFLLAGLWLVIWGAEWALGLPT